MVTSINLKLKYGRKDPTEQLKQFYGKGNIVQFIKGDRLE